IPTGSQWLARLVRERRQELVFAARGLGQLALALLEPLFRSLAIRNVDDDVDRPGQLAGVVKEWDCMRQDNQPGAVRSFDDDLISIERPALAETTSHPALVMRHPLPVDRRHPERTAVPILRVVQLGFAPPGEYGTPVVVRDETLGIACISSGRQRLQHTPEIQIGASSRRSGGSGLGLFYCGHAHALANGSLILHRSSTWRTRP